MQLTTKFSKGDRAYFPIFATATIYAVTVTKVYLLSGRLVYDLVRMDRDFVLEGVPEEDVCTFVEAKAKLVTYLETKLAEVNSLVAP